MNNPEYILQDELAAAVERVRVALGLAVLNFQYGYITDLNQTLKQWSSLPENAVKKFPLVWLKEPFTIVRGTQGFYGRIDDLSIFIFNSADVNWKAADRMENNYKPILLPIYRQLFSIELQTQQGISYNTSKQHKQTNRYYWGSDQQNDLNDVVDCIHLSDVSLFINDNSNCIPQKSF